MKKRKVRCLKLFLNIKEFTNIPVYIVLNGGWTSFKSFICIGRGEIYIADLENPSNRKSIDELVKGLNCPQCKQVLSLSLKDYPSTIVLPNKKTLDNLPDQEIRDISYAEIYEFYELVSTTTH